jgi:hypothetical protein
VVVVVVVTWLLALVGLGRRHRSPTSSKSIARFPHTSQLIVCYRHEHTKISYYHQKLTRENDPIRNLVY